MLLASIAVSLLLACQPADPPPVDRVRLSTGDVLTGTIIRRDEGGLVLRHAVLGDLTLTPAQATELVAEPAPAQPPPAAVAAVPVPPPAPPAVPPPAPGFWRDWKRHLEAGVSGAEGNTDNFNARGTLAAARKTPTLETTADIGYIYRTENDDDNASRGEANARNDWLFKDSPWGLFVLGKAEYDEFQDWDGRLSAFVGPSYTFHKSDKGLLRARAGLGGSYEIGGEEEGLKPEGLLGLDFERALTKRSRIVGSTEVLPSLNDFGEFRLNSKLNYEIKLRDQMSLKAGVAHRYDSQPGPNVESSDVDYFVLLGWDF